MELWIWTRKTDQSGFVVCSSENKNGKMFTVYLLKLQS